MSAIDIVAVSVAERAVFMTDGRLVPITNWFDADASECNPDDAKAAVAGPDSDGKWWAISLSDFGDQPRH